ncbi:MFS transporter [Candidatus Nitrotoga sp. 1052]|uniref:MFS transporter n=1 Tax=Candidatus Nitrotoga sp. 1052 TaxID=2886964 RepID=UPI001EF5A043|nr:MFS transporter [Candidatus Nitrotoga sp. 1052]CAH1078778.1 Vibrioferrin membrane-spanning transport protein PvsC [Candidatus Nitrotoga sp. 1052]
MKNERRRIVVTIMVCHFIAAFAALGMPPFFALILNTSLHSEATYLAGWLYVMPTFFTAISSPWWGKLADKYGKKPLLLRAQLGLAGSFLLAGFAPNIWVFFIALSLQGLLGGTFAASNAYLATVVSGTDLTRSLTLMQWSARAALVIAPAGLGLLMTVESPLELYRYLALLPLIAALFIGWLPVYQAPTATKAPMQATGKPREATSQQVYALQFAFIFATVITFPYFIPFIQADSGSVSPAIAGLLFGLPHLIYLLCAVPLSRYLGQRGLVFMLSISYLLLAASLFGQALFPSLPAVITWRIVMGFSMTIGFIGLHALIAGIVTSGNAGRTFGWFESNSKWGAVIAGLIAGTAVQMFDLRAPFFIGALTLSVAGLYLAGLAAYRLHLSNS